jgi:tetratricopeptide (TPR) repeat protein
MKKRSLMFFFLVLVGFSMKAQKNIDKDSLYRAFSMMNDDTVKIKKAFELGSDLALQGYNYEVLRYGKEAEQLSLKLNSKKFLLRSLRLIAQSYTSTNKLDSALHHRFRELAVAEETQNKQAIAGSYAEIASIYGRQFNFQKAVENYMTALTIAEELNNKSIMASIYGNLGIVYKNQKAYDKAQESYHMSLNIFKKLGNKHAEALLLKSIGIIYSKEKNYTKALEYYSESLHIQDSIGDKSSSMTTLTNMSAAYLELNDHKKSQKFSLRALGIAEETESTIHIIICHLYLGNSYTETMDLQRASRHLEKVMSLIGLIDDIELLSECYLAMSKLKEKQRDFNGSLTYYKRYETFKDSLTHITANQKTLELLAKYDSDKKDKEIKLLNIEKVLKETELRQKDINQRNILIGTASLIVLMALIGSLFFQVNKQKGRSALYKLQHEKVTSDLNFLKAQVNPHLIFNTLNTIYVQLDDDIERGRENLLKFSELMRYLLYECNDALVDIEKEINHINNYIHLQKSRKSETFDLISAIDENIYGILIAPLIFIPLIENAFKHLSNFQTSKNYISIKLGFVSNKVIFKCENTFVQKEPGAISNFKFGGVGLINLQKQLAHVYPGRHQFTVNKTESIYSVELSIDV